MKPEIKTGDCLEVLKTLESDSVDSLVTDPPAGISFMGKAWDDDKGGRKQWIAWMSEVMSECMRVMKPGAHGLVWAIPRTSHWTATALEDAGFEIRDVVTHLFGSGFPKSLDISKAMDKAAGIEREAKPLVRCDGKIQHNKEGGGWKQSSEKYAHHPVMETSCDLAKEWQGWGTALKPASEHWILVRKPISEKTVAKNVEKWGVGGINIDGCRIEAQDSAALAKNWDRKAPAGFGNGLLEGKLQTEGFDAYKNTQGRFPANLVLSCVCEEDQHDAFCPVHVLDEQSGNRPGFSGGGTKGAGYRTEYVNGEQKGKTLPAQYFGDSGGASRFFYVAKPSKRERNAGCEGLTPKRGGSGDGNSGRSGKRTAGDGVTPIEIPLNQNHHPTVKPIKLMRYLIRMITPLGGVVLDPFCGSGTTGVAAIEEGMRFLGIEREAEYTQIAEKRIYHAFPEFKKDVQS